LLNSQNLNLSNAKKLKKFNSASNHWIKMEQLKIQNENLKKYKVHFHVFQKDMLSLLMCSNSNTLTSFPDQKRRCRVGLQRREPEISANIA